MEIKLLIKLNLLIWLLFFYLGLYSQSTGCDHQTSVPHEMNRGRYKPTHMNYGNPYTMFNKNKPGWDLNTELDKIRFNIMNSTYKDNKGILGYGNIYKEIYLNAISAALANAPRVLGAW